MNISSWQEQIPFGRYLEGKIRGRKYLIRQALYKKNKHDGTKINDAENRKPNGIINFGELGLKNIDPQTAKNTHLNRGDFK